MLNEGSSLTSVGERETPKIETDKSGSEKGFMVDWDLGPLSGKDKKNSNML